MNDNQVAIEGVQETRVPWGARQAWWGAAALALWLGIAIGLSLLAYLYSLEFNFSLVLAFGELSLLLPVWWLALRVHEGGWKLLGLRPAKEDVLALGCGGLTLFYAFNMAYGYAITKLGWEPGFDYTSVVSEDPSLFWGLAFSAVLIAPFVEEVFFRGLLFAGFREKYGWPKAAAISALLFSLIHLQPVNIITFFLLGLLFAYVYERSGSLWPAVTMHATVNTIGLMAIYAMMVYGG